MEKQTNNPRPRDYKHILAWGRMLGSLDYYVSQEQQRAAAANAPLTSVYFSYEKKRWITAEECAAITQERLADFLAVVADEGVVNA